MKKVLFCTFMIALLCFSGISQNPIPNPDFENWIDDNKPNSWYGLVFDIMGIFQIHTLSKTADAQSGNFAALIESQDITLLGTIPGMASLAEVNFDLLAGGITFTNAGAPISVRPTQISGYYKYLGVNGDTAVIAAFFTKWNSTLGQRDTLGVGGFMTNSVVSTYTPFSFNISLAESPDSMNIMFISSGGFAPQTGSALYIDNLSMQYTSTDGIESIHLLGGRAYPNPATDEILFALPEDGLSVIAVYDITGKKVLELQQEKKQFNLDVRNLPSGIYQIIISQNGVNYFHKASINR
jgi:hypothetical protein